MRECMYHDDDANVVVVDDDDDDEFDDDTMPLHRPSPRFLSIYHIYPSISLSAHRVVEYAARQMKLLANSNRAGDTTTEERKSKEHDGDDDDGGQRSNSR